MHLQFLLGALALLLSCVLADPSATDIFYWPVGAPQPSVLARVAYDPAKLEPELLSYHPPSTPQGLVRVGLYTATPTNPKQWTGGLVSGGLFTGDERPTLRLHLGPRNEVFHVSVVATTVTTKKTRTDTPLVQIVPSGSGTQPHLNRPVIVNPDGGNPEEVEEKTFLQK